VADAELESLRARLEILESVLLEVVAAAGLLAAELMARPDLHVEKAADLELALERAWHLLRAPEVDELAQVALARAAVAVFVADEEMRYVAVNDATCRMLGYAADELLPLRVTDVARYPEAPEDYARMAAAGVLAGTARLTRKDGTEFDWPYTACETTLAGQRVFIAIGPAPA
jgi:PAS domain S-box-containing protein